MESEDSARFTDSLGQGPIVPGLDASKDLAIPSELEEPINLSVKKPPLVPVVNTSAALQQYQNPKGETGGGSLPFVRPQTEQIWAQHCQVGQRSAASL